MGSDKPEVSVLPEWDFMLRTPELDPLSEACGGDEARTPPLPAFISPMFSGLSDRGMKLFSKTFSPDMSAGPESGPLDVNPLAPVASCPIKFALVSSSSMLCACVSPLI